MSIGQIGVSPVDSTCDTPYHAGERRKLRLSYGCDCEGDNQRGVRVGPEQTDGIIEAIERETGIRYEGCVWRVMTDPYVTRVLRANRDYEKNAIAWSHPNPSHRLVEGVAFLRHTLDHLDALKAERDRKNNPDPQDA